MPVVELTASLWEESYTVARKGARCTNSSPPAPTCMAMGECAGCEGAHAHRRYVVLRAQGKPWLAGVSLYQRRRHVAGLSVLQVSHSPDDKPQANGDEIRNWQHAVRRD